MIRKLELDREAHETIRARCVAVGIEFLSTPFDLASIELLTAMGLPRLKISSGDVTNLPLLRAIGATNKPAILSTGMSTLADVEGALGALASGYVGRMSWREAFLSAEGQAALLEKVTLLHCTTEYPAPLADVNLRAMETLRSAFGLPVGYSDHTEGIAIPIAAVALGAVVIEKHVTTDRRLPGPDHAASIEPDELTAMVKSIRSVEISLGTGRKIPAQSELRNVTAARRSLVAAGPIRKGEAFTAQNVAAKRPGSGVSPMLYDDVLGRVASRDYATDELIDR
jgi:N-acetylneuraminate synthase